MLRIICLHITNSLYDSLDNCKIMFNFTDNDFDSYLRNQDIANTKNIRMIFIIDIYECK
jgi:hypothetical protein